MLPLYTEPLLLCYLSAAAVENDILPLPQHSRDEEDESSDDEETTNGFKTIFDPHYLIMLKEKNAKEKLKNMIEELKQPQKIEDAKKKQDPRRSPRKSRPPVPYSPTKSIPRPRIKHETPGKGEESRKRKLFVAETPEEKLAKKQCVENGNGDVNEVVAQTPFDKIKRSKCLRFSMLFTL